MSGKKPLTAIFITVFLDMLSFGTVIPDVQLRSKELVEAATWLPHNPTTEGFVIGLSIALFSIAQFLIAPWLGKMSDEKGRRPVLLITCTLAVFASLLYGFSGTLIILWLSRVLHGLAGANLGVAYAYIADVTTDQDRAKSMGLIGAAFGLGFIFGPPLGSILIELNNGQPLYLGLASAFFALINLIWVYLYLPESRIPGNEPASSNENRFRALTNALTTPTLGILLALFFVASFAFTHLETTYYRLGEDVYKFNQVQTSMVLVTVGIVAAVVQGGLIRILEPKFGERNLLRVGYLLQAPILASMPFVTPWWPIIVGAILLGTSSGIAQPSLSSIISKNAPADIRGSIFGINQSLGSLARIIGPFTANIAYAYSPAAPYLIAAAIMILPTIAVWMIKLNTNEPTLEPS